MIHPRTRRRIRRATAAAAVVASAALLSGCGIRATPVPVDAGAAPSRVGCVMPDDGDSRAGRAGSARVYLVCSSRVSPVWRRLEMPRGDSDRDRLAMARTLLDSLETAPSVEEARAGFRTDVPHLLSVDGPAPGDPPYALRLSDPVPELEGFALAQVVCTFAQTTIADEDGNVTLGGPGDAAPLKEYTCDTALRTRAGEAQNAGKSL